MQNNHKHKILTTANNSFFFAFQLKSIQPIIEIEKNNLTNYNEKLSEIYIKSVKFIEALIGCGENATFEIRTVAANKEPQLFRNLEIYFISSYKDITDEEASNLYLTIYHLLNSNFNEYIFSPVDINTLQDILNDTTKQYVYSIHRRIILAELDTLSSMITNKNFGFVTSNDSTSQTIPNEKNSNSKITYIFPFVPNLYKGENLFNDLSIASVNSYDIRIKLKPSPLFEEEKKFIEEQIVQCEKFSQIDIYSNDPYIRDIYPTLKNIAQEYQKFILNFLLGLKRNSALMTIEIYSIDKLSAPLLYTIANYISTYRDTSSYDTYFSGGYEIREITNDVKNFFSNPIENFSSLNLISHPLLPSYVGRLLYFFHSEEAASGFRFPSPPSEIIPNFELKLYHDRLAPVELIELSKNEDYGCLIGVNHYKNSINEIRIGYSDLKRHVYLIGQTGTGKTTVINTMILDLIKKGKGVCVLDPHGDLFFNIIGKIPEDRYADVVIIDPADSNNDVAINFLEYQNDEEKYFIANEFVGIIKKMLESEYGISASREFTGPIFYKFLRMMTLLVMSNPQKAGTIKDLYDCFSYNNKWKEFKPHLIQDEQLKIFLDELENHSMTKTGNDAISLGSYINSKLFNFVFDPKLRKIFDKNRSSINFFDLINNNKIILVNLAKGFLTEENSNFFGMLILTKLTAAAMQRIKIDPAVRSDFYIFVDEFQSVSTISFISLLSEARKFGLSLIIANQFLHQITDERIVQSIFGNVGTVITFRIGQIDATNLERRYIPYLSAYNLTNLPNWFAYVSTLCNGKNTFPFIIQTIPDFTPPSEEIAKNVREISNQKNKPVNIDDKKPKLRNKKINS